VTVYVRCSQEVHADVHQLCGVECAAAVLGGAARVRCDALESEADNSAMVNVSLDSG